MTRMSPTGDRTRFAQRTILSIIYLVGAALAFSWAINAYRHGADRQAGFDLAIGAFAAGMAVAYITEADR